MSEPEVLCRVEGKVGRITLNPPQAIHALTTNMIALMTQALLAWRDDPAVELVLIDHTGERGFCAGGDIRMLAESGAGDGQAAREFFFSEYRLNHLLFTYPKATVVVMDGVAKGSAIGLALPCRFRVATERTTFAVPDAGEDVSPASGHGWCLGRIPEHAALWLALTGKRIKAADCKFLGVTTDFIALGDLARFVSAVTSAPGQVEHLLAGHEGDPGEPPLRYRMREMQVAFGARSVHEILRRLETGTAWCREQRALMTLRPPATLEAVFRQLRSDPSRTLRGVAA